MEFENVRRPALYFIEFTSPTSFVLDSALFPESSLGTLTTATLPTSKRSG